MCCARVTKLRIELNVIVSKSPASHQDQKQMRLVEVVQPDVPWPSSSSPSPGGNQFSDRMISFNSSKVLIR
jgi:hypothetical protein